MDNSLDKYNEKRNFAKTKEPKGIKEKSHKRLRFVVQHHLARKDHYDFRLEWDGTLKSWAVPKGPTYNVKDKRLAVKVENHPLDYRNFEGIIPKGEYGDGLVMIWDEGYWEPLNNPLTGVKRGSLKFILNGQRLKGKWTLVRFKDNNWLLIKENDLVLGYRDINDYDRSIRTNRTMQEIENNEEKKYGVIESIEITNGNKVIFSKPKITKMDLVKYYQKVSSRMLPFINSRIMSTIRCPAGVGGEKFFKKHFDSNKKGLGQINISNDKGKKENYYYITDITGLIEEVQMNGYEFHIWGSSVDALNHPNMMVFDLDPDENLSLDMVRKGVKDLKSILDDLGLVSFLKTSGGKGYHVVVPFSSFKSWNKFRDVAKNIALLMEQKWPDKYVSNMNLKNRKNKIFIDWMRNIKGSTSVAPYSVRIRKKIRVSMPIKWSELDKVKPDEITINEALKRLKRKDPWANFFLIDQ